MIMKKLMPVVALLISTPLMAQAPKSKAAPPPPAPQTVAANPGVTAARSVWREAHRNVARSAEQMPEAKFSYKPTPEVRSFGELVAHVAGAEFMFCAMALGEPQRAENAMDKVTTKAGLVDALRQSAAYCERAYALTDVRAAKGIQMFGSPSTVMGALTTNAAHDYEHYGNIVTYLRMNGMVPPSSQPSSK
jgi:uncharacterized damage-inducible protein DinB